MSSVNLFQHVQEMNTCVKPSLKIIMKSLALYAVRDELLKVYVKFQIVDEEIWKENVEPNMTDKVKSGNKMKNRENIFLQKLFRLHVLQSCKWYFHTEPQGT